MNSLAMKMNYRLLARLLLGLGIVLCATAGLAFAACAVTSGEAMWLSGLLALIAFGNGVGAFGLGLQYLKQAVLKENCGPHSQISILPRFQLKEPPSFNNRFLAAMIITVQGSAGRATQRNLMWPRTEFQEDETQIEARELVTDCLRSLLQAALPPQEIHRIWTASIDRQTEELRLRSDTTHSPHK